MWGTRIKFSSDLKYILRITLYSLLVVDTSYSLEAVLDRQLESALLSRSLDGFFSEVWSVHPLASLVSSKTWGPKFGNPAIYRLAKRHLFIEAKIAKWNFFLVPKALNVVVAQSQLLLMLFRIVRRRKIRVIRAGDPLYSGFLGLLISKTTGVPLVVRVGSNNEAIYSATGRPMMPRLLRFRAIERIIERLVLSNADVVIAANQDNLEFAISSGASVEKSTLVRYGNLLHPCHFVLPSLRSTTLDDFPSRYFTPRSFILYIGRLEPVKHVDHVVCLLARVREIGLDSKLVICGNGSQREELEALAMNLGISDSVYFANNRNQQWLAKIIPQAALVVSPHTGRALCEVAYGAAPVVAYDVDWQGELIEDRITGLLVPFMDQDRLLHACLQILNDRSFAQSLGNNLRRKAIDFLDPETINQIEKSCYLRAIERFGCQRKTR